MALTELSDFEDLCREQQVTVDPRVVYGGDPTFIHTCSALGPLDLAIASCGNLLYVNPNVELADKLIDTPSPDSDIGLKTLVAMVNATRKRENPDSTDRYFVGGGKPLDCCSDFEGTMISSLESLQSSKPLGGDVIVDSHQNPIFFRKPTAVPSALALQAININYVPYPAGSIVRVDTEDAQELDLEGDGNLHIRNPRVSKDEVRVIPFDSVVGATFLRLSAFAYEADMSTMLPTEDMQTLQRLGCTSIAAINTMIRQGIRQ